MTSRSQDAVVFAAAWAIGLMWAILWLVHDWLPQGDEAIIALKTRDVLTGHPPVMGMRSTASLTVAGADAHHPGPIQFYVMAPFYALSGWHPVGLLIACVTMLAFFVTIAVHFGRIAGGRRGVALVALTVGVQTVLFGSQLVLPWNVFPPIMALVATIVLAWCLVRGRMTAMPWFVGCASFVLQANLAFVPVLTPLVLALAVVGWGRWRSWRGSIWPIPGEPPAGLGPAWKRPGVVATVVGLLCWLPSIIELFTYHPNNIVLITRLFTGVFSIVVLVGILVALACMAWVIRTILDADRAPARWAAQQVSYLVLLGFAGAIVAGGAGRSTYLGMALSVPVFALGAWGWRFLDRRPSRAATLALAAVATAVAVLLAPGMPAESTTTRITRGDLHRAHPVVEETRAALDRAGVRSGPVIIRVDDGPRAAMSYTSAVATDLAARGYQPYYWSAWPNREDTSFRQGEHAPATAGTVHLSDTAPPRVTRP